MENLHSLFGKAAGLIALAAYVPYIFSTLKGQTRPNRATWIIWTVVGVILLASYRALGAGETLWVSVANCLSFFAVVILSFKYGEGGWKPLDIACLLGAAAGLFLWWYLQSPLAALVMSILIDFLGAVPTLHKAYVNPASENLLTWILFLLANFLNLFALNAWNFSLSAYPIYLFLICLLIVALLLLSLFSSHMNKNL